MWQRMASWTRSLCAEAWKLLCLNLFFHSLPPPSFPFSPLNSTHTATQWKGVPAACFYHGVCLLKAAFTYMRRTAAAPVRSLIHSWTMWVQHEHPPGLQRPASRRVHALENACGLINSISGEKTRLHPSHVVQKNSLETCRQIAFKPPLDCMLLKTCDRKYVVVPDRVEHWADFFCALFAPQEMHLDPKSHGE